MLYLAISMMNFMTKNANLQECKFSIFCQESGNRITVFKIGFEVARYINIKPTYQNMEIVKSKNIQGYSTDKTKI